VSVKEEKKQYNCADYFHAYLVIVSLLNATQR
jgi:hypothetical protein